MSIKIRMKNFAAVIIFASVLAFMCFGAGAIEENFSTTDPGYMADSANIEVMSLKYEPYPVEPGEYFSLWIKVSNQGKKEALNVICVLEPEYPFFLDFGVSSTESYGKLGSLQQAVLKFEKIRVDENAVEGDNELKVKCSANGGITWIVQEFDISIQTRYATLNIKNIKTVPQPIAPGSRAQLFISFENLADTSMTDVTASLNLTDAPIAPYGEVPEKKVRRINSGDIKDLIFEVIALPDAEGGIYTIPLKVNYTDSVGNLHAITSLIAVEIGARPDIYVIIDSTTIHKRQKIGDITIKIVNKGLTDMKFLDVKLLTGDGYKIISGSQVYVGDLDSDDYETVDFRIMAKNKEMTLPLKLEYKDTSNKQYSEQRDIVFSPSSAQELGQEENRAGIILLIIIILVVIFITYKRWKKKNSEKTFLDFLLVLPRKLRGKKKKKQ